MRCVKMLDEKEQMAAYMKLMRSTVVFISLQALMTMISPHLKIRSKRVNCIDIFDIKVLSLAN